MKAGRPSSMKRTLSIKDISNKAEKTRLTFDLLREEHKKLKLYAVKNGKKINEILRDFINSIDEKDLND